MANNKDQDQVSLISKASYALASSIGIPLSEKKKIGQKLPTLSNEKLERLISLFAEEEKRNHHLLEEFFRENPDLFQDYDRLTKNHVTSLFKDVEGKEKKRETQRMKEILESSL